MNREVRAAVEYKEAGGAQRGLGRKKMDAWILHPSKRVSYAFIIGNFDG